ncbi:MAG: 8-oxo-dGTP diphosphatase [Pseudomonadota bacterium]
MRNRLGEFTLKTPWEVDWCPQIVGTLVFIREAGKVLLIHKKRGHGAGKINAPGGKLQTGETVLDCARRETLEEVGVQVEDLVCRAELRFVERQGDQWLGFVFVCTRFSGTPVATEEADPFWCDETELPFAQMWPDDKLWLPQVLHGDDFLVANVLFEDSQLLDHEFVEEPSIWSTIQR